MDFALIGPLEVRRDGETIPIRRGRPRRLLISLLLRVGRVVPAAVLIDEVWGDHKLTNAANALQVLVSYLRRVLELRATGSGPALRTAAGGYLLDVELDSVDGWRFERLVSSAADRLGRRTAADTDTALEELRSALALWRGEPLQDVRDEPFARAEIERLRELRATAVELQIDARLLLGQHEHVVPVLRQLIAEYPLRERLRGQLILALYRSGRQADALREYEAARRHLVEELGVDPGADLQRLLRAVLDHDPDLDWVPPLAKTAYADAEGPSPSTPISSDRSGAPRLPAPTNRLVGREREIARLQIVLGENRMVTLTGPGGAGKTRLALAVAHLQAERRPVWLVELAEVDDATVVPYEIAGAVGVATQSDPLQSLEVGIGDQSALLVLDTCEHLVDACAAAVHRLLRACPALSVLATSRQPLSVVGEVAWPVPPLAVPPPDATPEEVSEAEAVRLFSDRSRAVRPEFELDGSNAADVAAICRVVDGLPLAIELAAARIRVLSPAGILARLDDRFSLLRRVGRAADVRQRSLRAAIEWSHELLEPEQRRFFERLGVFAGRFTLDAAAAVAGHELVADPLELLSAVVDRSLVVVDGDDSYRMLDSLRAFAIDRLDAAGEHDAARARLACWLVSYCEATEPQLLGDHQETALARLRVEVPNIRSALEWTFTAGDRLAGVRLVCSLVWFWGWVGFSEEANRWLRRAAETDGLDGPTRARLLEGIAMHVFATGGDLVAGDRAAQEAARLWSEAGAPERAFAALVYRGLFERRRGDLDAAAATHDRAIAVARAGHDVWGLAVALYWRAATAADHHDDELAAELLDEALSLAERAGERRALGLLLHQLGRTALRRGDAARALDLAERAKEIHQSVGWNEGVAAALEAEGRALVELGRPDEAVTRHRRAGQLATGLGAPHAIAKALEGLAVSLAATDRPELAARVLGSAAAVRSRADVPAHATQRRVVLAVETQLRDALGDDRFDEAFGRGEQLEPGDALVSF